MSQQYYTPTPPSSAPNSGMAVASLIASILGLTLIPTIGSVLGLIWAIWHATGFGIVPEQWGAKAWPKPVSSWVGLESLS